MNYGNFEFLVHNGMCKPSDVDPDLLYPDPDPGQ